jgi:hypothetical protein
MLKSYLKIKQKNWVPGLEPETPRFRTGRLAKATRVVRSLCLTRLCLFLNYISY